MTRDWKRKEQQGIRHLFSVLLESTLCEVQNMEKIVMFFTLPAWSGGMIAHFLRCIGFAVAEYSFTLDALDLPAL